MAINVDELSKLYPQLALLFFVLAVLAWAFLFRRKGKDSEGKDIQRSSLLMPGWIHDAWVDSANAREDAQRRFYENELKDLRKQADIRVGEVRGYRDEALATNAQLLETLSNATRDIALVLQILDLASRNGDLSEASRASAKD